MFVLKILNFEFRIKQCWYIFAIFVITNVSTIVITFVRLNGIFSRKRVKNCQTSCMTIIKMYDITKSYNSFKLRLNYPLGSCLSATVILLKTHTRFSTFNHKKD